MMRTKLMRGTKHGADKDVDPMAGIINIVDVFLVCMAGVLAMFVLFYNVDLNHPSVIKVEEGRDIQGVSDFQDNSKDEEDGQYEKMGTVYVDRDTGNMYVITDEEEAESEDW
jgi:hypothetical protein